MRQAQPTELDSRSHGSVGWAASSGSIGFCDEGVATAAKEVVILATLGDTGSLVGEELRLLAARVQDIRRQRRMNCFAVTSPMPGEGKSTVAVGLAGALAREPGRRILLIESDLRRPSLTSTFGLAPAPGLSEWLSGGLGHLPVRLVEPGGFFLLVAGHTEIERPEVLGSPRMDALLKASRGLFDFVILDAMPILPVADAVLMQDLVDGFLLVVRSRLTPREAFREAMARLRADRILGVVLNDHHEYRDSYKARAYQRYGMGDGPRSEERPRKA